MEQIDIIGQKIFDMLISAGYWVVGISGLVNTLKSVASNDYENIIRSVIYTAISFGGLLLIPKVLDMIRGVFA